MLHHLYGHSAAIPGSTTPVAFGYFPAPLDIITTIARRNRTGFFALRVIRASLRPSSIEITA